MVILFAKHIPTRVTEKSYTSKKLTLKLQQTVNIVMLYYSYIIMANLFTKHIPTRVTKN